MVTWELLTSYRGTGTRLRISTLREEDEGRQNKIRQINAINFLVQGRLLKLQITTINQSKLEF